MTLDQISRLIGDSWLLHRQKDNRTAANNFREILNELKKIDVSEQSIHHQVDAYYGLGLAERANGNTAEAIKAFNDGIELSQKELAELVGEGINDLSSEEDDRFMMLAKMMKQRLAEMGN